jgi:hypothetical protein
MKVGWILWVFLRSCAKLQRADSFTVRTGQGLQNRFVIAEGFSKVKSGGKIGQVCTIETFSRFFRSVIMARTKQTARKAVGGKAPRKTLFASAGLAALAANAKKKSQGSRGPMVKRRYVNILLMIIICTSQK